MRRHGTARRPIAGTAVVILLAGCASGASATPVPATPAPTSLPQAAVATPTATATVTAALAPTPTVLETVDVPYESANTLFEPGILDVYSPTDMGPWPVVVWFPGGLGTAKEEYIQTGRRVADLGFVVFVAESGRLPGDAPYVQAPTTEQVAAIDAQGACAVAFARAHAAEYGGDPATMIVAGHSAGATLAGNVGFARPQPSAGCLGGSELGPIDALVLWEGDWLLMGAPQFDADLAAAVAAEGSRPLDVGLPWGHIAEQKDLRVVMLVSEDPGAHFDRDVSDPWASDSWLVVRDPSGDLRRQLEKNGAFADDILDVHELEQLMFSVLEAQGNPVSIDIMPGSTHTYLSDAGWEVFLAAFPKAAAAP